MGNKVSHVRSIVHDCWSNEQMNHMRYGGNERFRAYLEWNNFNFEAASVQDRYTCQFAGEYQQALAKIAQEADAKDSTKQEIAQPPTQPLEPEPEGDDQQEQLCNDPSAPEEEEDNMIEDGPCMGADVVESAKVQQRISIFNYFWQKADEGQASVVLEKETSLEDIDGEDDENSRAACASFTNYLKKSKAKESSSKKLPDEASNDHKTKTSPFESSGSTRMPSLDEVDELSLSKASNASSVEVSHQLQQPGWITGLIPRSQRSRSSTDENQDSTSSVGALMGMGSRRTLDRSATLRVHQCLEVGKDKQPDTIRHQLQTLLTNPTVTYLGSEYDVPAAASSISTSKESKMPPEPLSSERGFPRPARRLPGRSKSESVPRKKGLQDAALPIKRSKTAPTPDRQRDGLSLMKAMNRSWSVFSTSGLASPAATSITAIPYESKQTEYLLDMDEMEFSALKGALRNEGVWTNMGVHENIHSVAATCDLHNKPPAHLTVAASSKSVSSFFDPQQLLRHRTPDWMLAQDDPCDMDGSSRIPITNTLDETQLEEVPWSIPLTMDASGLRGTMRSEQDNDNVDETEALELANWDLHERWSKHLMEEAKKEQSETEEDDFSEVTS